MFGNYLSLFRQSYEEIIYDGIKFKLRQFISDLIGEDWLTNKINIKHNSYVDNIISYLSTIYFSLFNLSPYYIESSFLDGIKFISKIYLEILFNSNIVKSFNYFSISNLKFDIDILDNYFINISITHPGFKGCMNLIKNVIAIFFNKKIDYFLNNKNFDDENKIKNEDLYKFLMRYKYVKSQDKNIITADELSLLAKKLIEKK